MRPVRRGATLVESLVAMTVGGIVLALVAAISVRQQRIHADIAERGAVAGQLRQAAAILPIELRGVASSLGDLREARDTAIEFRATLASAVLCDTSAGSLILAPSVAGATTFASHLTAIAAADTAWIFAPDDSADRWLPFAVAEVATSVSGDCAPTGPRLTGAARTSPRLAIRLNAPASPDLVVGTAIRVTRPVRYSLYRGGDNRWYLGARDWNVTGSRFNAIQPVSGPFASPSARGLAFEYFDSTGATLPSPVVDTRAVALIRVALRAQSRTAMRFFGTGSPRKSIDTATLAVSLHNRR